MFVKRRFYIPFLTVTAIAMLQPAAAQLPPITVYGVGIGPGGALIGPGGGLNFGGGEPFQGFVVLTALAEKYEMGRDVRCLAGDTDLRSTTSLSPNEIRWLAAERVYRVLQSYTSVLDIMGGGTTPLKRDKAFTIIFADGGEETYLVASPYASTFSGGMVLPGSLKQKDGVVHRHIVCG